MPCMHSSHYMHGTKKSKLRAWYACAMPGAVIHRGSFFFESSVLAQPITNVFTLFEKRNLIFWHKIEASFFVRNYMFTNWIYTIFHSSKVCHSLLSWRTVFLGLFGLLLPEGTGSIFECLAVVRVWRFLFPLFFELAWFLAGILGKGRGTLIKLEDDPSE